MSDLISRSEYASKLVKTLDVLNKEYKEAMLNEDYELISAIQNQQGAYTIALRVLDNQPTAYDVDKVAEELKELRKKDVCDYIDCDVCLYTDKCGTETDQSDNLKWDKAIEIVKQGVIPDDVCEWKYNDTEYCWKSSCDHLHIFMIDGPKENEYDFCPYCGKKIKVVD